MKNFNPVIEKIEKSKDKNGNYPPNADNFILLDSSWEFMYKTENNKKNFVLRLTKYSTSYNYCSNKDSEDCEYRDGKITTTRVGDWVKYMFND